MLNGSHDTLVAQASAPGRASVGIVRISGPRALEIARGILQQDLKPRFAHYLPFFNADQSLIDQGIALYFKGPNSFTGEDIIELQGHGGPVVMDLLIQRACELGARLAQPGEFSLQAFLNNKIDLVQAESIAALIDASSVQAARSAVHSLQGAFSLAVDTLISQLIHLRIYIEAAIDFPEEEVDFLQAGGVISRLDALLLTLEDIYHKAHVGRVLTDGLRVVIIGRPNAGKSSILNRLAGVDAAIVTDIPGTTRDILRFTFNVRSG